MESVLILCQLIALCICWVKSQQETFAKWKQNSRGHWINSVSYSLGLETGCKTIFTRSRSQTALRHNGLNGILKIRQVGPVALPILLHILI